MRITARTAMARGERYLVLQNGVDVSGDCIWVDLEAQQVCLVMRDHAGHAHVDQDTGHVMKQVIAGQVVCERIGPR